MQKRRAGVIKQLRALPFVACSVCVGLHGSALAADVATTQYLSKLSIEELGNITITSVSRHAERLSDAAASIYVITNEDIRQSGARTLPEALRLAPNLEVARVTTAQYAISARGFNNGIGNKLLVLIDGRTVYTPLFSTVNWDAQHVVLQDVERIEVISGPGATLWGANAVNGVINVITRSAHDTTGDLVVADAGNQDNEISVRHGGTVGTNGNFRVYAQRLVQTNSELSNGGNAADGWQNTQVGFRADWGDKPRSFTVQGDAYHGGSESGPLGAAELSGANVLLRWSEQLSNGSSLELQTYYDHTERDDPLSYRDQANIFDIQLQHSMAFGSAHRLMWGAGYRNAQGSTQTHVSPLILLSQTFSPADRTLQWSNVFVQDELALSPTLNATLGIKAESNIYTGVEYLPSARIAWKPDQDQMLWSALSHAVRAPARLDRDYYVYLALPGRALIPVIEGGPNFQSETADVLELGYRAQPSSRFSFSITGFYNVYDKLRSGAPPPAVVQNMMDGTTHGVEAWASFQPTPNWRLSAGLTALRQDLRIKPGSLDPTGPSAQGNDPDQTWQLRSAWNLSARQQFDLTIRHVGALPQPMVPAYTAVDGRFNWHVRNDLDIALSAQNLLDASHAEFGAPATRSVFGRSVQLQASWRL